LDRYTVSDFNGEAAMNGATDPLPASCDLSGLSGRELDDLFRRSPVGSVPDGVSDGFMLLLPGTPAGVPIGRLLRLLAWQGKIFDARSGTMLNRVLPFGLSAVKARFHPGVSRLDGKPCFVLDYSGSSRIAHGVRDEIREVAPGVRLGLVYWHGIRVGRFALKFRS
jgi:hypothetical protein